MNETDRLAELKRRGYTVEVGDPMASDFNVKYHVYRKVGNDRKLVVVVDKDGRILGEQG